MKEKIGKTKIEMKESRREVERKKRERERERERKREKKRERRVSGEENETMERRRKK